tara:strand:- start:11005 stop:12147 length:1143 start_codon:yes stop_codon:yes gene_type:complete
MKVLYIAHYREFGGWSQAATDQMLALDKAGVEVVCRNITLTSDRQDINPKILEFERRDSSGCDFCIQHVLPHHLVGTDGFKKNIAFLEAETLSIKPLAWFENLKQMDEVWVANKHLMNSLNNDGLGVPVKLVHHATDISKYKKNYRKISVENANDAFTFYYIGDLNDRKNIGCISACFHSEFDRSEDVSLIIKVKKFGLNSEQIQQLLDGVLVQQKQALRMYPTPHDYKKEIVITSEIAEQELYSLHNFCDCFILPSHGEAWSIPSLDAVGFGNTPICSNFGGPAEFIDKDNKDTGTLVDGVFSCCRCSDSAFPDMFTGREYWFQPCEMQLRKAMRHYYESYKADPEGHKKRAKEAGLKMVEQFSYENIGKRMLEVLNES